jgi:hypothetical protein
LLIETNIPSNSNTSMSRNSFGSSSFVRTKNENAQEHLKSGKN